MESGEEVVGKEGRERRRDGKRVDLQCELMAIC